MLAEWIKNKKDCGKWSEGTLRVQRIWGYWRMASSLCRVRKAILKQMESVLAARAQCPAEWHREVESDICRELFYLFFCPCFTFCHSDFPHPLPWLELCVWLLPIGGQWRPLWGRGFCPEAWMMKWSDLKKGDQRPRGSMFQELTSDLM